MNPLTLEWVHKAEADWETARREYRARKKPNFDAAAFHAQQCVEKYLKARLQNSGKPIYRTHDLVVVLEEIKPVPLELDVLRKGLIALTRFAVETRYPGTPGASKPDVKELLGVMRSVRAYVRRELGLPDEP